MDNTNGEQKASTALFRFLRVFPNEQGIFIGLGAVFLFNSIATQISSVAAVSGFLKGSGVGQIPIIWIIDMFVILLVAGVQSLVIDKFERVKLIKAMLVGFAVIFGILLLMFYLDAPDWLKYGTMLIVSEQQWLFFPLIFWTLAQDIFSVAQAKRLFSPIASLGFLGRLIGLVIVSVAPQIFDQGGTAAEQLLLLNIVIYVLAFLIVAIKLKNIEVRKPVEQIQTMRAVMNEGWDFVKNVPAFKYLTTSIFAVNLSLTFIEFGFLAITHQTFTTNYQTFYGSYRLGLTILSFILQGFVTSRLIEKMTLKNAFLLMPLALTGGALWMLLPGAVSAIGGMVLPKVAQFTAYDSARRSLQAMIPEERRGRVGMFMESYLFAFGVIVASVLILLALASSAWIGETAASYIYRGLALATGLWAIWAILAMRKVYDTSMLDWRLKRRQRGSSILDKIEF